MLLSVCTNSLSHSSELGTQVSRCQTACWLNSDTGSTNTLLRADVWDIQKSVILTRGWVCLQSQTLHDRVHGLGTKLSDPIPTKLTVDQKYLYTQMGTRDKTLSVPFLPVYGPVEYDVFDRMMLVQQDQEELSFPDDVIRSSDTGVSELGST